jgi:hypothetical protein
VVNTRRQLTLNLDGGDAALFKFATGAPFVGVSALTARLDITMPAGVPTIEVRGAVAGRYQLQATASLPGSNWTTLTNLLLPAPVHFFADPAGSNASGRFYRAATVP